MLKHVLVPLDGSQIAEHALPYIQEIVDPDGGRVTLLTAVDIAVDYPMLAYYPAIAAYERDANYAQEQAIPAARSYLENTAKLLQGHGYEVDIESLTGDPASVIIECAEGLDVDAIIMSTHGRTGISRWIFGSVASKVLASTPCPIFVIPMKTKTKS